jgi:beta-phosphoglucomutase
MSHFKNIIFDLDGLIVDTEPLHQRAVNALLQLVGANHYFETAEYGEIFTGRSIFENAEYIRERFALPQTADQIRSAHHALFTILIADAENLEPMPGVQDLLGWLTNAAFRIGIASSSRPAQVELIIRNLNLHPHFEAIIGNDGTLKPNPAPDVYLLALEKLGANPNETLALEDSSSGVRAAHDAGLFVIAVPNVFTQHQDFSKANLVMRDLHQVQVFLNGEGEK